MEDGVGGGCGVCVCARVRACACVSSGMIFEAHPEDFVAFFFK